MKGFDNEAMYMQSLTGFRLQRDENLGPCDPKLGAVTAQPPGRFLEKLFIWILMFILFIYLFIFFFLVVGGGGPELWLEPLLGASAYGRNFNPSSAEPGYVLSLQTV